MAKIRVLVVGPGAERSMLLVEAETLNAAEVAVRAELASRGLAVSSVENTLPFGLRAVVA